MKLRHFSFVSILLYTTLSTWTMYKEDELNRRLNISNDETKLFNFLMYSMQEKFPDLLQLTTDDLQDIVLDTEENLNPETPELKDLEFFGSENNLPALASSINSTEETLSETKETTSLDFIKKANKKKKHKKNKTKKTTPTIAAQLDTHEHETTNDIRNTTCLRQSLHLIRLGQSNDGPFISIPNCLNGYLTADEEHNLVIYLRLIARKIEKMEKKSIYDVKDKNDGTVYLSFHQKKQIFVYRCSHDKIKELIANYMKSNFFNIIIEENPISKKFDK